jgi:hypothetical protein
MLREILVALTSFDQTPDRSAANVLGYVRDAGQRRVETVTQPLEHPRPPRVVLRDNRWDLHA